MSHLLESEAIDCDFAPVGGFTPAHTLQDYGAMGFWQDRGLYLKGISTGDFTEAGVVWAPQWGRKELLAIADGYRESAQSWRDLGRKVAMNVLAVPEANLFDSRNFPTRPSLLRQAVVPADDHVLLRMARPFRHLIRCPRIDRVGHSHTFPLRRLPQARSPATEDRQCRDRDQVSVRPR